MPTATTQKLHPSTSTLKEHSRPFCPEKASVFAMRSSLPSTKRFASANASPLIPSHTGTTTQPSHGVLLSPSLVTLIFIADLLPPSTDSRRTKASRNKNLFSRDQKRATALRFCQFRRTSVRRLACFRRRCAGVIAVFSPHVSLPSSVYPFVISHVFLISPRKGRPGTPRAHLPAVRTFERKTYHEHRAFKEPEKEKRR